MASAACKKRFLDYACLHKEALPSVQVLTPTGASIAIAKEVSRMTGKDFKTAPNKSEALAAQDAIVEGSGALNTLAVSLFKISQDIRYLGSVLDAVWENCSFRGTSLKAPLCLATQCEALTMVCAQVIGNHVAVTTSGMNGQFELNVFSP
jgi:fumarate hydratase, class II